MGNVAGSPAGGSGGAAVGDALVSDVVITVHPDVNTILVVNWTQVTAVDEVSLEFTFEAGNVMRSRPSPGIVGLHRDVVLGVPGDTDVTVRIVNDQGGTESMTTDYTGTTEPIPANMPVPEVIVPYDPLLGTADRWLFGSVEDSQGGGPDNYYFNRFWLYIMDRQGRIVWYFFEPSEATPSFQRSARDGEYFWMEKRCFGCGGFTETVVKRTLDPDKYFEEIEVPELSDNIDVTTDGSLLYDTNAPDYVLMEMTAAGDFLEIWDCPAYFATVEAGFLCYSNTINWNPADDSVLLSFPDEQTVIQIDRQTGAVIGQYGRAPGSYAFAAPLDPLTPPATTWDFGFQHFANINAAGNLMVSSHMPGFEDTVSPVANQHAFVEFAIDRTGVATGTLTEVWRYTEGPEWPRAKGMAIRLPNGNTLGNYGTGGVIREVTNDKQTAFAVKFDFPTGDDFYNQMVGNNELIDDLYSLNGSGPE